MGHRLRLSSLAIHVTSAAQAADAWFGDDSFESQFAKLWGVS